MKRLVLVTVFSLLFAVSASASNIVVEPGEYSFGEVVAGEEVVQQVRVTWRGDNPTALTASTSIEAESTDSEGINVSYSDNPVAFLSGDTRLVNVTVETSEALKPDNFTFVTEFSTSVTVDDGGSGGSTIIVEYDTTDDVTGNDSVVVRNVTRGELNESEEEDLVERIEDLENSSEERSELVDDLQGNLSAENAESSYWRTQFTNLRLGVLITAVLLVAGLLGKRFEPVVRERFE